jgi:hypothetical protein
VSKAGCVKKDGKQEGLCAKPGDFEPGDFENVQQRDSHLARACPACLLHACLLHGRRVHGPCLAATSKQVSYNTPITCGGEEVHAIVYIPEGNGPFPGVLVIHVVINYGDLATDHESVKKINAAVVGILGAQDPWPSRSLALKIFGAGDQRIAADDVKQLQEALERNGKPVNIKIYADAGHAF